MRVKLAGYIAPLAFTVAVSFAASGQVLPERSGEREKAPSCPLSIGVAASYSAPSDLVKQDPSCLIDAASATLDKASLVDTRDRVEFLKFHIPGAASLSSNALIAMPKSNKQQMVVYESGKFRSDAYVLCDRLRRAGMKNFKVLDGGIAAWAQSRGLPEKVALSQLSDQEVATAILDPGNATSTIATSFEPILKEHGIKSRATGTRKILLGEAATPVADLQHKLVRRPAGSTVLFWVGSKQRLSQLLSNQLAQDQKRLSGPGQSKGCGAL